MSNEDSDMPVICPRSRAGNPLDTIAAVNHDAYFTRIGERTFQPEQPCSGAWNPNELHVAPVNGLLVHALEQWLNERGSADGLGLSRLTFDYLGVIDFTPVELSFSVLRPGRSVELVEGAISQHGRPVLRVQAWRLARSDTRAVAGGTDDQLPAPSECREIEMDDRWPGDYVHSIELRAVGDTAPGRARVWMRATRSIVAGEQSSAFARWVLVVDTANGAAIREDPAAWQFPNLDLTIHLLRQPTGEWTGMDVRVAFGPSGQGLTSVALHDEHGHVGRAELGLLVRGR